LIVGGHAYVLTSAFLDNENIGLVNGTATVWRIALAEAQAERFIELGPRIVTAPPASDGQRLFVVLGDDIEAYDLADGTLAWAQTRGNLLTPTAMEHQGLGCAYAAVKGSSLFLVCEQEFGWRAWSLDTASGEIDWTVDASDFANDGEYASQPFSAESVEAAATDEHLVVATTRTGLYPYHLGHAVVLDLEDGAWLQTFLLPVGGALDGAFLLDQTTPRLAISGTTDGFLLHRSRHVAFYRPGVDAIESWEILSPFSDEETTPRPITVGDGAIYVPRSQSLFRASLADASIVWPERAADAVSINNPGATALLANEDRAWLTGAASSLYVLSTADGRILDQTTAPRMGGFVRSLGLGEGVIVAHVSPQRSDITGGGELPDTSAVTVLGTTAASLSITGRLDHTYPAVGAMVTLEAALQQPGKLAPDVAYAIDWGDGDVDAFDGEQATHTYDRAGDYDLLLRASNSAGQETSQAFTVHVGQDPPNFLSNAFAPDNQESTFFVLGLIILLVGSAFGVVRLRTKRRRLRRELAAADRIVAEEHDHPDRLRERLRDHRLRARRLFLDGRLDEGSTSILERHCDELLRGHRLAGVEEEFGFLPHRLFRGLQEILTDARVSDWERRQFLELLGRDTKLTTAEKKRVTQRVEQWHREDVA
jgi:outer membrane protein assembly factor BamB